MSNESPKRAAEQQVHKIALRRAFVQTIDGLSQQLLGVEFGSELHTSAEHLRWMLRECLNQIRTMPMDKMGRWVGFVQGVMAANGKLDVNAERDRTRPFFEAAYAEPAALAPSFPMTRGSEQAKRYYEVLNLWGILYNTPPLLTGNEWESTFKYTLEATCKILTETGVYRSELPPAAPNAAKDGRATACAREDEVRIALESAEITLRRCTAYAPNDEKTELIMKTVRKVVGALKTLESAPTSEATRERDAELEFLREQLAAYRAKDDKNYWIWQDDGTDKLESLGCHVLLHANQLRKLIARPPAPSADADQNKGEP